MATSAQEVYSQVVQNLPPAERLRLATLILNGLVEQNPSAIDESDHWTDEDQIDLAKFSLQYAATLLEDEETV